MPEFNPKAREKAERRLFKSDRRNYKPDVHRKEGGNNSGDFFNYPTNVLERPHEIVTPINKGKVQSNRSQPQPFDNDTPITQPDLNYTGTIQPAIPLLPPPNIEPENGNPTIDIISPNPSITTDQPTPKDANFGQGAVNLADPLAGVVLTQGLRYKGSK